MDDGHTSWLSEHLPYELKMLRYSYRRLDTPHLNYLEWNAHLASFATAACNLADFLTNGGKGSTVKAAQFVTNFRSRKDELSSVFQKLEPQIFHLGKARKTDIESKFSLKNARVVLEWLETEMAKFVGQLEPDLKTKWNHALSEPESDEELSRHLVTVGSKQTASAADPIIVTGVVGG